ncbi:MAG: hypothetical protein ACRERU_23510 [Methylococcales bacterium]
MEQLIVQMAYSWADGKKKSHLAFDICGLWGAGDITDDDVPITSFLQDRGSLDAQVKMEDSKVKEPQRKKFKEVFDNAHCTKRGLPDFFGYQIDRNLLIEWRHFMGDLAKSKEESENENVV